MKRKDVFDLSLEKSFKDSERNSERRFKGFAIIVPSSNKDQDTYSVLFEDDDRFNEYNITLAHEEHKKGKSRFFKRLFK